MTNNEKYDGAFCEVLSLTKEDLGPSLEYNSVESWDSIGHMSLIAELEDVWSISFETDDIIDFSSYEHGKTILRKYDIDIE